MFSEKTRGSILLILSLIFCMAGLKGFIEVTDDYYENDLGGLDDAAYDVILLIRAPATTVFFKVVTHLGDNIAYFLLVAAGMIFFWKKNLFLHVIRLGVVILFTSGISYVLKELIRRPRPLQEHFVLVKTLSFPSGHAMTAAAFYMFITILAWRTNSRHRLLVSVFSFLMILLIGLSRVYLGVHYLSDVLAGYSAGIFICGLALLIYEITDRLIKAKK